MIVPQFFGYHDRPTWTLDDTYSKWTLTLFKPWRTSITELKADDGTLSTTLKNYMWNNQFPPQKRAEIQRAKRKEKSVDLSEGGNLVGDHDHTPTDNRTNDNFEQAGDCAMSPDPDQNPEYEDISDAIVVNTTKIPW